MARKSEVAPSSPHLLYLTNSLMHACAHIPPVKFPGCAAGRLVPCHKQLIQVMLFPVCLFVCLLILLACCYRLLHAQDMLLATHDCGSYSSGCTPSCGARRLSSSFLLGDSITLSFCPFRPACSQAILLIYACFSASIESPFPSPPLLSSLQPRV